MFSLPNSTFPSLITHYHLSSKFHTNLHNEERRRMTVILQGLKTNISDYCGMMQSDVAV